MTVRDPSSQSKFGFWQPDVQGGQFLKNRELGKFSDEDLLMELRHRDRIKHLCATYVEAGWRIRYGSHPPDEYVQRNLGSELGRAIADNVLMGKIKIPGFRIEEGYFLPNSEYEVGKDKKFTFPLNFVVEP